jgi:hypothetical protein
MLPAGASQHQRRNRRRPYDALTYSKRKQLPRFRKRSGATVKKSKTPVDLMGVFKVFASLVLLSSSLLTYMLHLREHPDENERNIPHNIIIDGENSLRNRHQNHYSQPELPPQYVKEESMNDGNFNAYSIIDDFGKDLDTKLSYSSMNNFFTVAKEIRNKFASLYGGEQAARAIIRKGISTFQSNTISIEYTAKRIQMARKNKHEFRFGFAGYSVTTGRGNYFNQSFPFVVERILQRPMEELGIKLKVINAGIGGVPSFPYGLCLQNFLGDESLDVVSWDFSMNEASDAVEGIEAYIRRILTFQPSIAPMLLMKDTHMAVNRSLMIRKYVEAGAMYDPIVLHTDPATEPFLQMEEGSRPEGFKLWRQFGAPPNAPGKSKHHPAKQEHEFIGWLLVMHFLSALELLALSDMNLYQLKDLPTASSLPAPMHPKESSLSRILYGTNEDNTWKMEHTSCRTSFDPIMGGDLRDIVVSKTIDSLDMMLPKGAMMYNTAWVLDLGDSERRAKQQLARFGGLGFIDSKKAFYGVHASGSIEFFLEQNKEMQNKISSVIVCESNEKRDPNACIIETDMNFMIGGLNVEVESIDFTGFTYLGKNICVYMSVPPEAKPMKKKVIVNDAASKTSSSDADGFVLEVYVRNPRIRKKEQACCISHVIWL